MHHCSLASSITQTVDVPNKSVVFNVPLQVTLNMGQFQVPSSVTQEPDTASNSDSFEPDGEDDEEKVIVNQDYSDRKGYNPGFLGNGPRHVPLPVLSPALEKMAAINEEAKGKDSYLLPYHHYSVVMNKKRKFAIYAAVNIDGDKLKKVTREGDRWYFDTRIPRNEQSGHEVYKYTSFDRGHLVRRLDAAWGETDEIARTASDDTFHFSNCAPQHKDFNRNKSTWAGLENYIFNNSQAEGMKVSVFNGPLFDKGDQSFRGINIPRKYWKIVVMVKKSDKRLSATGYLLSQEALIEDIKDEEGVYLWRVPDLPGPRFQDRVLDRVGF